MEMTSRNLTFYDFCASAARRVLGESTRRFPAVNLDEKAGEQVTVNQEQRMGLDASVLARLEKLAVNIPGAIYQYQQWPDGRTAFPYASGGMRGVFGVRPEDITRDASAAFARIHREDLHRVAASIAASAEQLSHWVCTFRVLEPGGSERWLESEATPERQRDGSTLWYGYIRDVTARIGEQQERQRLEAETRLAAAVFDNSSEVIVICDRDNRIVQVNEAFVAVTGYQREEALGRDPGFLAAERQEPAMSAAMWESLERDGHWRGEVWNQRKNGELYAQLLSIAAVHSPDGELDNYIAVATDITELKRHEDELHRLAHYDPLTGIPNRRLLTDRVGQCLRRADRSGKALALCYLDLDGFKAINDRCGHSVGDRLLSEVARRLQGELRGDDTVARLGGDEFVLLLNDVGDEDELAELLNRVLAVVRQPVALDAATHGLSASIGVTLSPPDDPEPDRLMRHADQAMYRAKEQGRNGYVFYESGEDRRR